MKVFTMLMGAALLATACASPKEKYEDQKMEAKEDYKEDVKQAEEDYYGEDDDAKKERAKEMIDKSDDVNVDVDKGEINLED